MVSDRKQALSLIASQRPVSRETIDRLDQLADLLTTWQKRINLVAPGSIDVLWTRHLVDSFQSVWAVPDARSWIDLGSGGGFPGLVIAIWLAESGGGRIDMVESNAKKCAFLRTAARELQLSQAGVSIEVHNQRIGQALPHLPQPDAFSARALAPLKELLTMTEDRLRDETLGVFPKGRGYEDEIAAAEEAFDFKHEVRPSILEPDSVLLLIKEARIKATNRNQASS